MALYLLRWRQLRVCRRGWVLFLARKFWNWRQPVPDLPHWRTTPLVVRYLFRACCLWNWWSWRRCLPFCYGWQRWRLLDVCWAGSGCRGRPVLPLWTRSGWRGKYVGHLGGEVSESCGSVGGAFVEFVEVGSELLVSEGVVHKIWYVFIN